MTSATERLRALLDERGVEWRERQWGGKHSVTTFWHARGVRWRYRENRFGELRLHADGLTPEQAVDATLGPGTCEVEVGGGASAGWWVCSACGALFDMVGTLFDMVGTLRRDRKPNYCPECGKRVVG